MHGGVGIHSLADSGVAVRPVSLVAALLATGLLGACETARLAFGLEAGMQLLYESEGERQSPWSIDSVSLGATLREGSECAVVHLRRRPDQSAPEESRLCLANDTLYRWDTKHGDWAIMRPVGPGMSWTSRQLSGDVVRYETGEAAEEKISGARDSGGAHDGDDLGFDRPAETPAPRAIRPVARDRYGRHLRVAGLQPGRRVAKPAALRAPGDSPESPLTGRHHEPPSP